MGLVTSQFVRSKRRHAIVAITVLASFLSPGDVLTVTILLMIPLVILYEVSILIAAAMERRRQEEEEAEEVEFVPGGPADGAVSFNQ